MRESQQNHVEPDEGQLYSGKIKDVCCGVVFMVEKQLIVISRAVYKSTIYIFLIYMSKK